MITIRTTNDKHGTPTQITEATLGEAIAELQNAIRACGPEFADTVITEDDYEVVEDEITYDISEIHPASSGEQVFLYLIPSAESDSGKIEVVSYSGIGPGCPVPAWNRRWFSLPQPPNTFVAQSLIEELEGYQDVLREINTSYLGSEWDGRNHVGRWSTEIDAIEYALEKIDLSGVATYWDATEWLEADWPRLDAEISKLTSMEELANDIVAEAKSNGAMLSKDEVLNVLRERSQEN